MVQRRSRILHSTHPKPVRGITTNQIVKFNRETAHNNRPACTHDRVSSHISTSHATIFTIDTTVVYHNVPTRYESVFLPFPLSAVPCRADAGLSYSTRCRFVVPRTAVLAAQPRRLRRISSPLRHFPLMGAPDSSSTCINSSNLTCCIHTSVSY